MFTKKIDSAIKKSVLMAGPVLGVIGAIVFLGIQNRVTDIGYRPNQPIPFSHKVHADTLAINCQYCHAGVEESAHSPIPSTQTCMNCHNVIEGSDDDKKAKIKMVRESWEKNEPIAWRRIHHLPDYVNFNHSRHIRAQIDCASCHGEVEKMGVVSQFKSLSMGFCLDCHRNPEANIVPARGISGIFVGEKTPIKDYASMKSFQAKFQMAKYTQMAEPAFGAVISEIPRTTVPGMITPKHPAIGPENCSACHQ